MAAGGFIDFFAMEATEYIEQLDALLLQAHNGPPDGESLQRTARALRGSATMARLPAFAELAAAVEGIGRATRDGVLAWDAALRGAMISAIDDCKLLVRAARTWGASETERAENRARELATFAPTARRASSNTPVATSPSFLVDEAKNIAAGLELVLTRPDNIASVNAVLSRVRALRGLAGLKDLPPLPEVTEAAEDAAHPLELGDKALSLERAEVLRTASALLRRIADALREGRPASEPSTEYEEFVAAVEAVENSGAESGRIVPIASLYYDDAGPHVVSAAPNPPTTPQQRFRMEAVSVAEHLTGVVAGIRATQDPQARERGRRGLRRALRNLRQTAESFGEQSVVDQLAAQANVTDSVDEQSLTAIEKIVASIAHPDPLNESIATLDQFSAQPFAEPAVVEAPIVPIDALVYRGRAAIERAVQIRDQIRSAGSDASPELLGELFDLLDLALTE